MTNKGLGGGFLGSIFALSWVAFCFVDPYKYHMDLCNESCWSAKPYVRPSWFGKNLNIGHYMHWTLHVTTFFTPDKLIGTIDFYYCIPLSLTLTLPGGRKVSSKQKLLSLFSCIFFDWSGWNLIWYWTLKQFKLNILILFLLVTFNETGVLLTVEKLEWWHAFRCLWISLIQTSYDYIYYHAVHFDASLIDLNLDSRSQECEKAKPFVSIISQSFQSIECNLVYCWDL